MNQTLNDFKDVLTDIPGGTNLGKHVIKLTDQKPIRSKPYPIPHALRNGVNKEIETMLKMGVISQSDSPFASPLVLVKIPDGSNRLCCDMRKVNQLTIFDAEPLPDQEEI